MVKNRLYWWADRWAVRIADRMGVTLGRAKPLDLRGKEVHPLEGFYRAERYQPVLVDVPISRLRGLGSAAFPCTREAGHPFIQTLLEYEDGRVRGFVGSALQRFYQSWQPTNAAEYLGLVNCPEYQELKRLTALEAVLPWSRLDPEIERAKKVNEVRLASTAPHGRIKVSEGRWHFFGPATAASGEHEYQRLVKLYRSIRVRGYLRSDSADGDIRGVLMLRGDRWCVQIVGGGQHRASVFSALGHAAVPVRLFHSLPTMVRLEDACFWPHVVNGLFSRETAVEIYDRIFFGQPPWVDHVKTVGGNKRQSNVLGM